MSARVVWPLKASLGEGPVWSARENAVYFVDIKKPALHRYSLADGAQSSWDMPEQIGWVIERKDGRGFIAGFQSGFFELSLDPFERKLIGAPEPELPRNRRNDAKVDTRGRIWAGSMDDAIIEVTGALFRLDPDFTWKRMDGGYKICNGPTFNLAGNKIYHTDTAINTIFVYDLSPAGEISNKRTFMEFTDESWGKPDGMTTDAEDHIWVAHWGGSRVSRFTPEGKLDRFISIPGASQITSCCFAGESLERMFVTSAAKGVDEANAGALFEVEPGVRGAPQTLFG
jgi:sugar lactone lactonase YvrE